MIQMKISRLSSNHRQKSKTISVVSCVWWKTSMAPGKWCRKRWRNRKICRGGGRRRRKTIRITIKITIKIRPRYSELFKPMRGSSKIRRTPPSRAEWISKNFNFSSSCDYGMNVCYTQYVGTTLIVVWFSVLMQLVHVNYRSFSFLKNPTPRSYSRIARWEGVSVLPSTCPSSVRLVWGIRILISTLKRITYALLWAFDALIQKNEQLHFDTITIRLTWG